MTGPPPHRLFTQLTFAERVAALWSALASLSVGVVVPLLLLPEVAASLDPEALLDDHARRALNPWLGHFLGALSGTMLVGALLGPLRQELGRLLLILSLVVALASGFYTSWALQSVVG
jgi:hypothetical protein